MLNHDLIWGTSINFAFLRSHQCSSRLVTVILGTAWSSIKQIEAPYVFHWENGIVLHTVKGNRASCLGEWGVSWDFSSCGISLGYNLELRQGCPFETRVSNGHPRCNSRIYPRFLPQLEKTLETFPSPRDEARFPCIACRAIAFSQVNT